MYGPLQRTPGSSTHICQPFLWTSLNVTPSGTVMLGNEFGYPGIGGTVVLGRFRFTIRGMCWVIIPQNIPISIAAVTDPRIDIKKI